MRTMDGIICVDGEIFCNYCEKSHYAAYLPFTLVLQQMNCQL